MALTAEQRHPAPSSHGVERCAAQPAQRAPIERRAKSVDLVGRGISRRGSNGFDR